MLTESIINQQINPIHFKPNRLDLHNKVNGHHTHEAKHHHAHPHTHEAKHHHAHPHTHEGETQSDVLKSILKKYGSRLTIDEENLPLIQSLGFSGFNPENPEELLKAVLLKEDGATHFEPEALKFLFPEAFGLTNDQVVGFLQNTETKAPEKPDQCCEIKGTFDNGELSIHLHGPYHGENKRALLALALAGHNIASEMLLKLVEGVGEFKGKDESTIIESLREIIVGRLSEGGNHHNYRHDHEGKNHKETLFSNWTERFEAILKSLKNLINSENQEAQLIFLNEIAGKGFFGKIDRASSSSPQIVQENKKLTDEFIKVLAQFRKNNPNLDREKLVLLLTQIHNPSIQSLKLNQSLTSNYDLAKVSNDDLIKVLSQAVEILTRPTIAELTPDEIKILDLAKQINEQQGIYYINLTTDHQGAYHFLETKDANGNLVKVGMCPDHTKESDKKLRQTLNSINQLASKNQKPQVNHPQFLPPSQERQRITIFPPPFPSTSLSISDRNPSQPSIPSKPSTSPQSRTSPPDKTPSKPSSSPSNPSGKRFPSLTNRTLAARDTRDARVTRVIRAINSGIKKIPIKPERKSPDNENGREINQPIPSQKQSSPQSQYFSRAKRKTKLNNGVGLPKIYESRPRQLPKSKAPLNFPLATRQNESKGPRKNGITNRPERNPFSSNPSNLGRRQPDRPNPLKYLDGRVTVATGNSSSRQGSKEINIGSRLRKALSSSSQSKTGEKGRKELSSPEKAISSQPKTTSSQGQSGQKYQTRGTYEGRQANNTGKSLIQPISKSDNPNKVPGVKSGLRAKRQYEKYEGAFLALSLPHEYYYLPTADPYGAKRLILELVNS